MGAFAPGKPRGAGAAQPATAIITPGCWSGRELQAEFDLARPQAGPGGMGPGWFIALIFEGNHLPQGWRKPDA